MKERADVKTASDDYAKRFAGAVGNWFLQIQEHATLSMLAPYPGASVLDVGGGHGQIAPALIGAGYDVTVLGSDETCVRRLEPLVGAGLCSFEVGDILNLPFGDNQFDIVISYRLISHVNDWKECLAEMAHVASRAVVIDYPEVRSFNYVAPYLFRLKRRIEGNTRPYTCFHMSEIVEVFEEHGFYYEDQFREFFLPMVLHRQLRHVRTSVIAEKGFRAIGLTDLLGSPVILKVVRQ